MREGGKGWCGEGDFSPAANASDLFGLRLQEAGLAPSERAAAAAGARSGRGHRTQPASLGGPRQGCLSPLLLPHAPSPLAEGKVIAPCTQRQQEPLRNSFLPPATRLQLSRSFCRRTKSLLWLTRVLIFFSLFFPFSYPRPHSFFFNVS